MPGDGSKVMATKPFGSRAAEKPAEGVPSEVNGAGRTICCAGMTGSWEEETTEGSTHRIMAT